MGSLHLNLVSSHVLKAVVLGCGALGCLQVVFRCYCTYCIFNHGLSGKMVSVITYLLLKVKQSDCKRYSGLKVLLAWT